MNTFRNLHLTTVPTTVTGTLTSSPTEYVCTTGKSFSNNEDDDLLESLSGDESVSSSLTEPSLAVVDDALVLLSAFEKVDAVALLERYYAKKGVKNLKKSFAAYPSANGGKTTWRCTFTCPISGTTYYSGLPRGLLAKQGECEELARKVTKVFGKYHVAKDYIFFSTKRGAKKSVTITVLEALNATGITYNGPILYHSVDGAYSSELVSPKKLGKSPPRNPRRQKRKLIGNYPCWVLELCDMGIDVKTLTSSFREYLSMNNRNNDTWSEQTLLCCVLSIKLPIRLSVVGLPHKSKGEAIGSAVTLLSSEVQRQLKDKEESEHSLQTNELAVAADTMEQVFACVGRATSTYVYPLPPWATVPFPEQSRAAGRNQQGVDAKQDRTFYLYELEFLTQSGNPFVSTRMGLDMDCVTRLGIVFAKDPCEISTSSTEAIDDKERKAVSFQAIFQLQTQFGKQKEEKIKVVLKNRTRLTSMGEEGEDDADSWAQRLLWIKMFNSTIHDGNNYGFGQKAKKADPSRFSAEETSNGNSLLDRTYMYVPLCIPPSSSPSRSGAIDWTMLRNIAQNTITPYYLPVENKLCLPCVGKVDLYLVGMAFGLIDLALFAPSIYMLMKGVLTQSPGSFHPELQPWEILLCLALAVIAIVCVSSGFILPPRHLFTAATLANRFLLRTNGGDSILYVLHSKKGSSDSSVLTNSFQEHHGTSDSFSLPAKNSTATEKHQLQKLNLTFGKSLSLCYPKDKLLGVHLVKRHIDHNLLRVAPIGTRKRPSAAEEMAYIHPKHVKILPMPRDVLYLCRLADRFMPPLERAIEVDGLQNQMILMGRRVRFSMHRSARPPLCLSDSPAMSYETHAVSLSSLIDEATTLTPPSTYQRLEFLGDAVLSFFLAINAMARNSSLQWDYYDLTTILSDAGSNRALFNAALRIGVSRFAKKGQRPWRSAYRRCKKKDRRRRNARSISFVLVQYRKELHTAPLADKVLSDIVESLLAVAFVAGRNSPYGCNCGTLVIGLLEELQLPFPEVEGKRIESGWPWFRSMGRNACLTQGYNFELDKQWQQQLIKLGTILYCKHEVIDSLEQSWRNIVDVLADLASMKSILKALESQSSKILMLCALFDQSLPDELSKSQLTKSESAFTEDSVRTSSDDGSGLRSFSDDEADGLYRLALLRDTLFHIGNNALQLFVSDCIFQRYPKASEGDLTLLRSCSTTDDVVVYIMISAGFHEFLHDREATAVSLFRKKLLVADAIGANIWKERGGWILKGGIDEFRRRSRCRIQNQLPRYCGLAGGRLYGHQTKLPAYQTEDLSFSMKAIIGALVLSIGLEGMQCCIGPLFEETMLLSAQELREEYKDTSTICRGNRDN